MLIVGTLQNPRGAPQEANYPNRGTTMSVPGSPRHLPPEPGLAWVYLKVASRLVPDGCEELTISGCGYHFRTFQLELDNLDTKNFGNGSVVKKLQLLEVGRISENLGKSQVLMRPNPRIFRFFVKLYTRVHQNLNFFEKTQGFVLINSRKLNRFRTSP